jgi:acyl-CoA ligase (AMP-forming) (exosortase A-associated)
MIFPFTTARWFCLFGNKDCYPTVSELLHQLIVHGARYHATRDALHFRDNTLSYEQLHDTQHRLARALCGLGLSRQERVAVYLPKQFETVVAFFAASQAGAVFVPVNPVLKAPQVGHILRDCNARILITSANRLTALEPELTGCHDLQHVVLVDDTLPKEAAHPQYESLTWKTLQADVAPAPVPGVIDADMAAILYTSGSTGKPKGVVLSHRNMVAGAKSVAQYLNNDEQDRLLAVLPFSFDYGFSQLTTAFHTGACAVLMDYLLPRDVTKAVAKHRVTGLAAVPPLWVQLGRLEWPDEAVQSLRYITNSGGAMPTATLRELRRKLPSTRVYLMYGLTEAFRSTYLPPEELDRRPESMGKAIPNAEVMVVREDGAPCAPGEPGELVHRGALVAMGYWNDPQRTAERFRPAPGQSPGIPLPETAVWSGDSVKMDEDGYLYFIGRKDDMIKTSGYRVSPTEIEEVVYASGHVGEAVALGIPHPALGQAIVVAATARDNGVLDSDGLLSECKKQLPNFMVPAAIEQLAELPRNPNGKIDRKALVQQFHDMFNNAQ